MFLKSEFLPCVIIAVFYRLGHNFRNLMQLLYDIGNSDLLKEIEALGLFTIATQKLYPPNMADFSRQKLTLPLANRFQQLWT